MKLYIRHRFSSKWLTQKGSYVSDNCILQFYKCFHVLAESFVLFVLVARKILPDLLGILSAGTKQGNESDDTLAVACQTANCLLIKEPELGMRLLNNNLINSLNDLSQNR